MIRDFAIVWGERSLLLSGLANTTVLSVLSATCALLLAILLTPALMARWRVIAIPARGFVDAMRCIPFLLFAYIVYYGLPSLGLRLDNWSAGLAALIVYNTAYMAEILRGAWQAQPREPIEAGIAFGFPEAKLFRRIILPPLLLTAGPVLGNQISDHQGQRSSPSSRCGADSCSKLDPVAILRRSPPSSRPCCSTGALPDGRGRVSAVGRLAERDDDFRSEGPRCSRRHQTVQRGEMLYDVSFRSTRARRCACSAPSGSASRRCCAVSNWLERPDAGQIYLNGQAGRRDGVRRGDARSRAFETAHIGMVFQHFALWPHHRAAEYHRRRSGRSARRPGSRGGAGAARQGQARDKRDAFPARLSGGRSSASACARAHGMPRRAAVRRADQRARSGAGREVLVVMRDSARGHDHGGSDTRWALRAMRRRG